MFEKNIHRREKQVELFLVETAAYRRESRWAAGEKGEKGEKGGNV
jgi:hypothetical protein